jgi:hypothetical protein
MVAALISAATMLGEPLAERRSRSTGEPVCAYSDDSKAGPSALTVAEPNQDRHLMMIVAALPVSQRRFSLPQPARRNMRALSSTARQPFSKRRAHPRPGKNPPPTRSSPSPAANYPRHQPPKFDERLVRDPKIPIGRARPNSARPTVRCEPRLSVELRNEGRQRAVRVVRRTGVADERDRLGLYPLAQRERQP